VNSKGSLEFSNDHRTGAEWAALLKTAEANVSRWRAGKVRPGAETRKRIHALGGPEPTAWDDQPPTAAPAAPHPSRQPKAKSPPSKKRRKPRKATAAAVIAEADHWLAELEGFRAEIPTLANDTRGRAALLANAAKTLVMLGKLTGVGLSISERKILDSPNWRILEGKIIKALTPWPDALRAVARAIDATRGGQ